jgi:DegV family protein with EDD domain
MESKIGLVIDEGADLPEEIIKKEQIEVVPFKLDWPEVKELPGENIYQKMREAEKRGIKTFGKTSQPSPKDFLDAFKRQFEKGFEKLVCITITSKHSGTFNSAIQAKSFLGRNGVFILDSLNVSGGEGILVLKAIDLIKGGEKRIEEILKELEIFRSKIQLRAALKDPKWAEASGRISHLAAKLMRRLEKIGVRPLIGLKEGVIKAMGLKSGVKDAKEALFKELEEKTRKLRAEKRKIIVAITHADNLVEAQKLKEIVEAKLAGVEVVFLNLINNFVGALAGLDALSLAWSTN